MSNDVHGPLVISEFDQKSSGFGIISKNKAHE